MPDAPEPRAPRSSAQIIRNSLDDHHERRKSRALRRAIAGGVFLLVLVWGANAFLVARPTAAALAAVPAFAGIDLRAHLHYFLDPTTLVLDLRSTGPAPEDAFRALAAVAGALHAAGRDFERVVLTHRGDAVYVLTGADFARFGDAVTAGRSTLEVARGVPARLRGPAGSGAVGLWAPAPAPVLGLLATAAPSVAQRWAAGGR